MTARPRLAAKRGHHPRRQTLALPVGRDGDAFHRHAVQRAGGDDFAVVHQHGGIFRARVKIQPAPGQKRFQLSAPSVRAAGFHVHMRPPAA